MSVVVKFNRYIDELNDGGYEIPHGDNVLECLNNILLETGVIEARFTTLEEAVYEFCLRCEGPAPGPTPGGSNVVGTAVVGTATAG